MRASRLATSLVVAMVVRLILALFGALFAQIAADVVSPVDAADPQTVFDNARTELTLSQSLLLVWPQVVGLVAATVAIFAVAYIAFMRQEVRA